MKNCTWWLIVEKQEMTRVWVDGNMTPVTLVKVLPQQVVRKKTTERDWYDAIVVWVNKKDSATKWSNGYAYMCEYRMDASAVDAFSDWQALTESLLADVSTVRVEWVSKWKWFQWWMKRYNFGGWPATHGSKFHRALWSTGNRKPRRTHKWKKMAWHMWSEKITLKSVGVVDTMNIDWEMFLLMKGSVPGAYHGYLKLVVC